MILMKNSMKILRRKVSDLSHVKSIHFCIIKNFKLFFNNLMKKKMSMTFDLSDINFYLIEQKLNLVHV